MDQFITVTGSGLPIVLNPILGIPFFLAALFSGFATYYAIYFGIIPPFNGAVIPWTTPVLISGFLVGGWQALILVCTIFICWPFAKKYDNVLLAEDADAEAYFMI